MSNFNDILPPKPVTLYSNFSASSNFGVEEKVETAIQIADKISDKLIEVVKKQFAEASKKG